MSESDPVTRTDTASADKPAQGARTSLFRAAAFAEQELRLISVLVVFIGFGLFLALPFVLSIGSVVFLPVVTALMITIILSPLADRFAAWGLPNILSSLFALLVFFTLVVFALALVFLPAVDLIDEVPAMFRTISERLGELRGTFAWIIELNDDLATMVGGNTQDGPQVVLAGPSVLQQLAVATPTAVLAILLTFLMAFFMIEARVRMRRRLLLERSDFGASVKAARVMRDVQDRVASYILTVAMINAGQGVIVALGAWALGVDAPIMWGGLAALLNFLPYIGPVAMIGLLTLFGVGTAETMLLGLIPALAYLALHTIEANIVTPTILGARFTMNPVMILIALSYFSWIWGITGALLSVPILLTLTALFDHVGRPNLIGFLFGEPLFNPPESDEDPAPAATIAAAD